MSIENLSKLQANQRWVIEGDDVQQKSDASATGAIGRRFHRKETGLGNVLQHIATDIGNAQVANKEDIGALVAIKDVVKEKSSHHMRTGWIARKLSGQGNVKVAAKEVDQQAYKKLYETLTGIGVNGEVTKDDKLLVDRMYSYLTDRNPSQADREQFQTDITMIARGKAAGDQQKIPAKKLGTIQNLATIGFPAARTELSLELRTRVTGNLNDANLQNMAKRHLKGASEEGHVPAMKALEMAYRLGDEVLGIERDSEQAHLLAHQLSDIFPDSALQTATDFITGEGVEASKDSIANAKERCKNIMTDPHASDTVKSQAKVLHNLCQKLQIPPEQIDRQAVEEFTAIFEQSIGSLDTDDAQETLMKLANADFPIAQFVAYEKNFPGVGKNLQKAAAAGVPEAQFQLAKLLENDEAHIHEDVYAEQPTAEMLYGQAADQDHSLALFALARLNTGNLRDSLLAAQEVLKDSNLDGVTAQEVYSYIGETVAGPVNEDPSKSPIASRYSDTEKFPDAEYGSLGQRFAKEYQQLAKQLPPEGLSLYSAAFAYKHGLLNVEQSKEIAQELMEESGAIPAFEHLANEQLKQGNFSNAAPIYRTLVNLNQPVAVVRLARMIESELIEPAATENPKELYAKAGEHPEALYRLGVIADEEVADMSTTTDYFIRAADKGSLSAANRLIDFVDQGILQETDVPNLEIYRKIADVAEESIVSHLHDTSIQVQSGQLSMMEAFDAVDRLQQFGGPELFSASLQEALEDMQRPDADIGTLLMQLSSEDQELLGSLTSLLAAMDTPATHDRVMEMGTSLLPDVEPEPFVEMVPGEAAYAPLPEPIDKKKVLTSILAAAQPVQNYALGMALAKQGHVEAATQALSSAAIESNPLVADLNTVMRNVYKDHADLEVPENAETYALLTFQWAQEKEQNADDQEARRLTAFTALVDAFAIRPSAPLAKSLLVLTGLMDSDPSEEEIKSWNEAIENK